MTLDTAPLVFVTVGTDHHPFDRLVQWLDSWIASSDPKPMRYLVQVGTSTRPRFAEWQLYVPFHEMEETIRRASIVVCHGGPGTFMLCRHLGKKPIVVPRKQALGEHVDNHQVAIARRMAGYGAIELAETEDRFREAMDRAAAQPELLWLGNTQERPTESVRRFEELVEELLGSGPVPVVGALSRALGGGQAARGGAARRRRASS